MATKFEIIFSNNNNEAVASEKKSKESNQDDSNMTYVVFFGLLMDLLAFTLILPLFPSLLDHYKNHDGPDGLFNYLDTKVKIFGTLIGVPEGKFNSVLFGGLLGILSIVMTVSSQLKTVVK